MDDQHLLQAVANALATRRSAANHNPTFDALARFVRGKVGALTEAGSEEDRITAIYNGLQYVATQDPELVPQLAHLWSAVDATSTADHDAVSNTNTGTVSGNVVQARDVRGGINIGRAGRPR